MAGEQMTEEDSSKKMDNSKTTARTEGLKETGNLWEMGLHQRLKMMQNAPIRGLMAPYDC